MRSFGHGFGLRTKHYAELLRDGAPARCVEAITENVLDRGGRPAAVLERVRADAEVVLHGVSLSIGGSGPFPDDYLARVRALADRIDARLVSDHACFGTFGGHHGHDLWPLPFTEEALTHVATRVERAQTILGRTLALENLSSYVRWSGSELSEHEFLAELVGRTGCALLLDVNNVHISAHNHGFDAHAFIDGLPVDCVAQFHLAGHSRRDELLFDDHGSPVPDEVLALYEHAVRRFGDRTCIIEWDEDVPELSRLLEEVERARAAAVRATTLAAVA